MGVLPGWLIAIAAMGLAPSAAAPPETLKQPQPAPAGVLCLAPAAFTAEVGGSVPVRLLRISRDGDAATEQPWADVPVHWFYVRVAGTQQNSQQPPAEGEAGRQIVALPLRQAGVTMAGVELDSWVEDVDAAVLRQWLEVILPAEQARKLDAVLPAEGPVRLRRLESAKVLIGAGPDVGSQPIDPQTATSKAGQRGEIRLLADPWSMQAGSDLPVRAYTDWDKRGHVILLAERIGEDGARQGERQRIVLDAMGIGAVRMDGPGVWRVIMHHAAPAAAAEDAGAGDGAVVELHTASVVFPVAGARAKEAGR